MNEVRLPALTGTSPLGILAAMGVLRLLSEFSGDPPRLRWDRVGLTAVLCSRRAHIDHVVEDLRRIVNEIPEGSVLPGLPADFPPSGAAPDKLRVPQEHLPAYAAEWLGSLDAREQRQLRLWLASLVTDLAADSQQGRVAISLFTAPSGKQSMATMLAKPLEQVRKEPVYLKQALEGWRRVAGVTGEYLDHRAMWDATEDGGGATGSMRGVPGATWLALMSFPMLRTTASGKGRPISSGWHTVTNGRRRSDELRLPVWEQPLGMAGVVALIEHPALLPVRPQFGASTSPERDHERDRRALGVIHICRARRRRPPGSKSAGVLTTVTS
ncbi:MAG: type I-G CRISPR-associated protein, Cas3-extension family [Nocardioides sp.]